MPTLIGRREALLSLFAPLLVAHAAGAQGAVVSTLLGTGAPGRGHDAVDDPYGLAFGPAGALYFCDLGNQRIRRLDLQTRRVTTVAGTGVAGYTGDGGPATQATVAMPHELQFDREGHLYIVERDNHVVRRVDARTGIISTLAGTGVAGFSGDEGPAAAAQLRSPHSIAVTPDGRALLIGDIGNHRIRRVNLDTGRIHTFAGTGERAPTSDGAPVRGTALNGPRALAFDDRGDLYIALREGNAIYRLDARSSRLQHVAGVGVQGYSGDGGPARVATLGGPKGLAWWRGTLYVADTENHAVRAIDLATGVIRTVLGTGVRGDGPEPDPRRCALARPHGVLVGADGTLYVGDSEAHRIRRLQRAASA